MKVCNRDQNIKVKIVWFELKECLHLQHYVLVHIHWISAADHCSVFSSTMRRNRDITVEGDKCHAVPMLEVLPLRGVVESDLRPTSLMTIVTVVVELFVGACLDSGVSATETDRRRRVLENRADQQLFFFRPFTIMPASVACWTSSSTNDCMLLTADLSSTSVTVVSSMYLCVRQPSYSASIKITNVSRPRYDPCGMPPTSAASLSGCRQSWRTVLVVAKTCRSVAQWYQAVPVPPAWRPACYG